MYIARAICGLTPVKVAALWSCCSLQKYLERWPAALYVIGRSVLMLTKGSKIPIIELNTVRLYQHYLPSTHNKLQYTWREVNCECVRPAQLPVLTAVRAASLLPGTTPTIRREKANKMQQLDVYYFLSQHVSDIIMPIFRRTKALLLHLVCCSGSAGCGW